MSLTDVADEIGTESSVGNLQSCSGLNLESAVGTEKRHGTTDVSYFFANYKQ
jgi:hypothetical protein